MDEAPEGTEGGPSEAPTDWRHRKDIEVQLDKIERDVDKNRIGGSNLRAWIEDALDAVWNEAVSACSRPATKTP